MMAPRTRRASVWALAASAALAASPATAQEAEPEVDPNQSIVDDWPAVRWVAFVDQPPPDGAACQGDDDIEQRCDCDPFEARYGRCVEEVGFDPLADARANTALRDPAVTARARDTSDLHFWLWEDLTWQFGSADSPAVENLLPVGTTGPLPLGAHWDRGRIGVQDDDRVRAQVTVALPERRDALGERDWLTDGDALYPALRPNVPRGATPPPTLHRLSGRFAMRLGADNRRLRCGDGDCELLDADPETAAPFYEQMYPVRRARVGDGDRPQPLRDFEYPDGFVEEAVPLDEESEKVRDRALGPVSMDEDSYAALQDAASGRFLSFSRLVGSRIAEFGMADHTTNQMRVFAALTAMRFPPGALESSTGITRDLVAAALGQTDDEAAAASRVQADRLAIQGGFAIRYEQLPESLVTDWLTALTLAGRARQPDTAWPPPSWWTAFEADLGRDFEELRRVGRASLSPIPRSLAAPDLDRWVRDNLQEGLPARAYSQQIQARALGRLVELVPRGPDAAPTWSRDRVETWLLLDHLHQSLAGTFDATPGARATPNDLSTNAADQWRGTLAKHRVVSNALPQGLNAVDPTAICTTLDGRDALTEPSFGAVNVDLLLAAADGAPDAEAVLWERRDDIPFLAMDQPAVTRPVLDRLVGLPGGRALYRVRWQVWTGWHLLWDRVALPGDASRAVLRVAAVCDDLVLSPPGEVPTLVRAALLEGVFQPTEPVRKRDIDEKLPQGPASTEDPSAVIDLGGVGAAVRALATAEREAESTKSTLSAEDGARTVSEDRMDVLAQRAAFTRRARAAPPTPPEVQAYLRSFVLPPLRAQSGSHPGVAVMVFDHSDAGANRRLGDLRSRTPYARVQRRAVGGGRVTSAGWSWYLPREEAPPAVLGPAFQPRESDDTDVPMPRWRRPRTLDWTLGLGLAHFPLRAVSHTCNSSAFSAGSVAPCDGQTEVHRSEGFGAEFLGLANWWVRDRTRLGLELGVESRLDVLHGGRSWYWGRSPADSTPTDPIDPGDPETIDYAWSFRPSGGMVVGARFAPKPAGLWRRTSARRDRVGMPWGADRPDGRTRGGRTQWGIRSGFLMGPGFNALEGTAMAELWGARSFVRRQSPRSTVPPYRPAVTSGLFVRGMYGFPLGEGEPRYRELTGSWTLLAGFRMQLRLSGAAPSAPSAPAAPEAPTLE